MLDEFVLVLFVLWTIIYVGGKIDLSFMEEDERSEKRSWSKITPGLFNRQKSHLNKNTGSV